MPGLSFVVVAAVGVGEIIDLPFGMALLRTLLLLVAFTALHLLARRTDRASVFVSAVIAEALCAIGVMAVGSSASYGVVLFFVICPLVSWRLPQWVSISLASLAIVIVTVMLILRGHGFQVWFPAFIGWSLGFSALIGFSAMYQRAKQEQAESEQLLAELTEAQDRVREMAILKERDRLAREMHDAVGHRLTVVSVLLESAGRFVPTEPQRAMQIVETSRSQVREGLDELRTAVRSLVTEGRQEQPIADMLRGIVEVYSQATEGQVSLDIAEDLPEPDSDRKLVIVRTAQEGLTNAQKHAHATRIELVLAVEGGAYLLTCRDNGCGIGAEKSGGSVRRHFGLDNLQTRAAAIGGSIELCPRAGGGAELHLMLPLPRVDSSG